ncbi:uncharacterized protein LOC114759980 [Neltuma alba]|uniref:uncharacterized protein LOC114759980 n=1 Tax=Neltuma alba TaxID=207710 RepID=UPI0010A40242|nr:uncharacterized protein LOC114759980 [Prosopis alba]
MEEDFDANMEEDFDANMEEDYDIDDVNQPEGRKVRGSTRLPKLAVRHGRIQKKHVDFDANMNPIGEEKDRFISYIGSVARSKVNILWPNWKSISKETKDRIWEYILQTYDIPRTEQMKKHLLQQVRQRWKDFKHTLTSQ